MTPPSTHAPRTARRSPAPRAPRRTSGPARPRRTPAMAAPRGGAVAVPAPLGLRLARRAWRVRDARLLDRLVRGRAWIAIVGIGLLGIVFMQVSMLRLNAGISRAVTAAETLQQQNSTLRAQISELDSGQRIADTAAGLGMVMPEAGDVHYLDARQADGRSAAHGVRRPNPDQTTDDAPPATATTAPTATAPAATATTTTTAPVAATTATTPAVTQPQVTTPAPSTTATAPATTTPAAPAAATAPAATTAPATTAAPVTAGGATAPQGG
jgi:cell division protein FtsB